MNKLPAEPKHLFRSLRKRKELYMQIQRKFFLGKATKTLTQHTKLMQKRSISYCLQESSKG